MITVGQITQNILNKQFAKTANKPPIKKTVHLQQDNTVLKAEQGQQFIHPIITPKGFKQSIIHYNHHIKKYNMQVWVDNAPIRKYNKTVTQFRKDLTLTALDKAKEHVWKQERKNLSPEKYNKLVESYNKDNGLIFNKRALKQPVKKDSETYFIAILHQLNMQLFERKKLHISLDIHYASPIPKVKLYPNKITQLERDGYTNLPVSVETFRHHRERLLEAGVLLNYEFRGSKRAVKTEVNPEILCITDNPIAKNTETENQQVKVVKTKKVPHNNVSSRTYSNKFNIRDKGDFSEKEKSDNNDTRSYTRPPKRQDCEKKEVRAKNFKESSEKILSVLQDQTELSQDLSKGRYNNYNHLPLAPLRLEAMYGSINQHDFKELAIQDIFKFSSNLFKYKKVHPGSWQNAFNIWLQDMFTSPNGYTLSKPIIIERWEKCLKILKEVKKFQKKNKSWNIPYPSQYFDPQRKHKEENGFEYAYRFFRLKEKTAKTDKKRKLEHLQRTRAISDLKKAQLKVDKYIIGQISLDDCYEYVKQNCSKNVFLSLNDIIKKSFNKYHNL